MRQQDGYEPGAIPAGPTLRVIRGEEDEAYCTACGAPTGMHPRWWFDGEDQLVPYCESCSLTVDTT
jgi:hypothetical protein